MSRIPPLCTLQTRLLAWYNKTKRILPWRDPLRANAYAVWVSEIMLQQTRVETVIPYFEKWMRLFPTIQSLAKASEHDVLNAWEGLGYYSRARNLHNAAKVVVKEFGGRLPDELNELIKLPGIGRYTAGAIASIVFGKDEPALDGNLKRVYSRLFDIREPIDSPKGEELLWSIARENLPKGKAGDFNQALMDLGAMICLPKTPRCSTCPLKDICKAHANRTQEKRPVKKPRKKIPHYVHTAGVIVRQIDNLPYTEVLLVQRPSRGLLGGMWEFPNGRVDGDPAEELVKVLKAGYRLKVRRREALGVVQHTYTHFKVTVHAFRCELSKSDSLNLIWLPASNLWKYPMGKVDREIAVKLLPFLENN